jgi:predicted restriction endonuclease
MGEQQIIADEGEDFNPHDDQDARERTFAAIVRRRGQSRFRRSLLRAYTGQCAVTACDAQETLEAAHILPYRGQRTNHVTNGLLLRADLHSL